MIGADYARLAKNPLVLRLETPGFQEFSRDAPAWLKMILFGQAAPIILRSCGRGET